MRLGYSKPSRYDAPEVTIRLQPSRMNANLALLTEVRPVTRKRDRVRSYPPDYCSRETLAYRLDCSVDKINTDVRSGLLPPPEEVGTLQRWHWDVVAAWIKARNGQDDEYVVDVTGDVRRRHDEDPFSAGVKRVSAANT